MSRVLLAIDVGGSTTRAVLIDEAGRCLGQGRNKGGNPASNSPDEAASAMISAVEAAVSQAGGGPLRIAVALIALAGPKVRVAIERLESAFRAAGLTGPIVFGGDLQAMFASVTAAMDGYCIVAGTGSGAVRIRNGEIERVVDAAGYLLGDSGSGYWLGHQAARAVCAELEGRGEKTALTPALLAELNIQFSDETQYGRPAHLRNFIDAIYGLRPIELARFSRLVIAHRSDPVAARLIDEAERYLAADFALVYDASMSGPVALGGGVIAHLTGLPAAIGEIIRAAGNEPDIRLVSDGSLGAAVLAMRAAGLTVDEAMVKTIASSMAARSAEVAAAT